ncbi:MAG: hypothetical protein RLZZ70_341 [Candidatus Parcubacteria bacterium]|jgi:hypothetical protein
MGLIRELLLSLSINWLLYTSWQFYLTTQRWVADDDDDPPDGGIEQGATSMAPLLNLDSVTNWVYATDSSTSERR